MELLMYVTSLCFSLPIGVSTHEQDVRTSAVCRTRALNPDSLAFHSLRGGSSGRGEGGAGFSEISQDPTEPLGEWKPR